MSDKSMMMDTPDGVTTRMEIAGGSPPAEIRISKSPDRLQTEISVTSTEMADGSPPVDIDICEIPEVLLRAGSVTAVVSEKWMERFVINPKVICLDDLAPDDDPARRSSDVGSNACVQNQIPTVVSVRTVVAEKWMDRFVLDLVECSSVSRTSAVAWTFGPAVSEEYSPVVFAGGAGADAYPLVVVESDTAQVFFWGRSPLMWLAWAILLTLTEERAQLARAAPGVTPVDSSEKGAPVRELIWPSVLGEPPR